MKEAYGPDGRYAFFINLVNMRYLLFLLLFPVGVSAQNIKDLHFMSGKWVMQHEWGDMEENWSEPMGNSMVSTFRCVKDGKVLFYEFMVIEQTDSVPVMYMRHFNPGSIGWEEKGQPNVYPLAVLEKNKAVFEQADKKLRLIFLRKDATHLTITLDQEGKLTVFDLALKK